MYEQSEAINEIAASLAMAQGKFEKVVKDTANPFFKSKYADLATLIDATRNALASEGIAVVQAVGFEDQLCSVTTSLLHKSGQWLRGNIRIPLAKMDAQGMGSASTYGRRYALQSMLNVAGEADDDGNAASQTQAKPVAMTRPAPKPNTITELQAQKFWETCRRTHKSKEQVRDALESVGVHATSDIPKDKYEDMLAWAEGA